MGSSSSNRRILIIGADGAIGRTMERRLRARGEFVIGTTRRRETSGPDRPFLDLAVNPERAFDNLQLDAGDVAVLTAARARLADCEADPSGAYAVNVGGTLHVARRLASSGVRLIHLSTNQVLPDDRPLAPADTPPQPRSAYGRQKAEAEAGILHLGGAVLRLAKVFAPQDPLLTSWRRDLLAGVQVRPFSDMTAAPVRAELACDAVLALANSTVTGIYQLSAKVDVTYADLARHLARIIGADETLVRPSSWRDAGLTFTPAQFSSMDGNRLLVATGLHQPNPFDIVREDDKYPTIE